MNERSRAIIGGMSGHLPFRKLPGPFAQRIGLTTVGLTLLFAFLAPAASEPLGFGGRLVFWALHIGIGLGLCELAAESLIALAPRLRDWRLVVLSGLLGVVLFSPIAYGLELLFPVGESGGPDTVAAAGVASGSLLGAIAVEALELAPPFLATWLVINTEPIAAALRRDDGGPSSRSFTLTAQDIAKAAPSPPESDAEDAAPAPANALGADSSAAAFTARLPRAIGIDVLAVSSDLHYLQVSTRLGRAMVLGALREVDDAYGDAGIRVHRSHWVHLDAVARLRQSGDGWLVELVNGQKLPVSRRKRREVSERLGRDFVREDARGAAG